MELSGVSSNSGDSRITNNLESFLHEITLSDYLSISRPLIAGVGLYFFNEKPVELSACLTAAFASDFVDGAVARRYGSSKYGAYLDIFGDRALEYLTLITFAAQKRISWVFPAMFITKGIVTDSLRLRESMKKDDFSKPLAYGGNDKKLGKYAYGFAKMMYLSCVPFGSTVVNNFVGI